MAVFTELLIEQGSSFSTTINLEDTAGSAINLILLSLNNSSILLFKIIAVSLKVFFVKPPPISIILILNPIFNAIEIAFLTIIKLL